MDINNNVYNFRFFRKKHITKPFADYCRNYYSAAHEWREILYSFCFTIVSYPHIIPTTLNFFLKKRYVFLVVVVKQPPDIPGYIQFIHKKIITKEVRLTVNNE